MNHRGGMASRPFGLSADAAATNGHTHGQRHPQTQIQRRAVARGHLAQPRHLQGVVAKYLGLASAAGLDWPTVAELDEAGLERRLLGRSVAETQVVEADFARVHVELRRKGVTLMLLWQEYRAAHEGRRAWAYTAAQPRHHPPQAQRSTPDTSPDSSKQRGINSGTPSSARGQSAPQSNSRFAPPLPHQQKKSTERFR